MLNANISLSKGSLLFSITAILIAMISLQAGSAIAKSLISVVDVTTVTAMRLSFGSIILCIAFRPWQLRFAKEQYLPLVIYGLSLASMNFLFYNALKTIPLGVAVGLEFTGPLTLALLTSRRLIDFIWIATAAIGLWFLLQPGRDIPQVNTQGALYALSAGIFWAIYIISGQRAGAGHGPATVAIGTLIGAIFFVPLAALTSELSIWQWNIISIALLIALLSGAIPYALEMIALTRLPARVFGTMMSLEPAIAALSGILFLNEQLALTQWVALLAIIIASVGTTLTIGSDKSKIKKIKK